MDWNYFHSIYDREPAGVRLEVVTDISGVTTFYVAATSFLPRRESAANSPVTTILIAPPSKLTGPKSIHPADPHLQKFYESKTCNPIGYKFPKNSVLRSRLCRCALCIFLLP